MPCMIMDSRCWPRQEAVIVAVAAAHGSFLGEASRRSAALLCRVPVSCQSGQGSCSLRPAVDRCPYAVPYIVYSVGTVIVVPPMAG